MTSLHPPSFHRNDFSTCSTHFSFFILPQLCLCARARRRSARACARGQRPLNYANVRVRTCIYARACLIWRRSVSASEEPHDLPYEFTVREKRSLGVRAHLHRLWMTFGQIKSAHKACSGTSGDSGFTE